VEVRELANAAGRGDADVRGVQVVAGGDCDDAVTGDAELSAAVGPIETSAGEAGRNGADGAVEADTGDARAAMLVILDVDRATLGRPDRIVDRAVEGAGQDSWR